MSIILWAQISPRPEIMDAIVIDGSILDGSSHSRRQAAVALISKAATSRSSRRTAEDIIVNRKLNIVLTEIPLLPHSEQSQSNPDGITLTIAAQARALRERDGWNVLAQQVDLFAGTLGYTIANENSQEVARRMARAAQPGCLTIGKR